MANDKCGGVGPVVSTLAFNINDPSSKVELANFFCNLFEKSTN